MQNDFKIDFVVTWVDGSDPVWQKKRASVSSDFESERYRDYGLFKYWFRAVEKYAPWVNKIYLITDNQIPDFLNLQNSKLRVVDHTDIMPADALPTFNSNAIEMNVSKIQGLSEHFVVFNDDMFLNKPVTESDFFSQAGLPMDAFGLNQVMPVEDFDYIIVNNMKKINQLFNKRKTIRKNFWKYYNLKNGYLNLLTLGQLVYPRFSRFYDLHAPYSFTIQTFEDVLNKFSYDRDATLHTKIRSKNDISIWLVRYYQLAMGIFANRTVKFSKFYTVANADNIAMDIKLGSHSVIDVNDVSDLSDKEWHSAVTQIKNAFEMKLEAKSSFEK